MTIVRPASKLQIIGNVDPLIQFVGGRLGNRQTRPRCAWRFLRKNNRARWRALVNVGGNSRRDRHCRGARRCGSVSVVQPNLIHSGGVLQRQRVDLNCPRSIRFVKRRDIVRQARLSIAVDHTNVVTARQHVRPEMIKIGGNSKRYVDGRRPGGIGDRDGCAVVPAGRIPRHVIPRCQRAKTSALGSRLRRAVWPLGLRIPC